MRVQEDIRIRGVYDDFSMFYRELIDATGRTAAETKLLDRLRRQFRIPANSPVLDAACGTGDALAHLASRGFTSLYGLDASQGMLLRAKELNPQISFVQNRWDELRGDSFKLCGRFRVIYLLSLSLPHAEKKSLPKIFNTFRCMLQTRGQLIFDVRDWRRNSAGVLRERGRNSRDTRVLGGVLVKNRRWQVTDQCSYSSERQIIQYTFCSQGKPYARRIFKVSYALLTAEDYIQMLADNGFCDIAMFKMRPWPYLVLVAHPRK